MTAQIKVKVQRKAIVKFKVQTKFPANVVAQPGIIITRSGQTYTFSLDATALPSAALQALADNTGTGLWAITGTGTGHVRTLTGTAAEITVTFGDGVSGNPTISIPAAVTFTGKTVTGGTFNSPALVTPALGTPASGVLTNATGLPLASGVTGALPFANLAQGSAHSVLGVTGNATATVASIQGSAGQIFAVPNAGTSLAFTSTPQIGLSGTLGSLTFGNATSGLVTLQPVTGALGTVTVSIPAATDTLVCKATTDTLTNKTISGASNTLTNIGGTSIRMGSDAQGDILYFNGTNYVRLPPGTSGNFLKTLGAAANPAWAAVPGGGDVLAANNGTEFTAATFATNLALVRAVKKQFFTATGTYTPSTGMLYAVVEAVGGGGGGGGASSSAGNGAQGGGGGGGDYSRILVTAAAIGASKAVTIGAAGTAGAAAAGTGGNGGDTSLGVLCVAKGGSGGVGNAGNTPAAGGVGGIAGTGDFSIPGEPGESGVGFGTNTIFSLPAKGGSAGLGFGAGGASTSGAAGSTGGNYGGGGGGGNSFNGGASAAGGAGGPGMIHITEYCTQ